MTYHEDSIASLQNVEFLLRVNVQGVTKPDEIQAQILQIATKDLTADGVPLNSSGVATGAKLVLDAVFQPKSPTSIAVTVDATVFQNAVLQKDTATGKLSEVSTWFSSRSVHHELGASRPIMEDVDAAIREVIDDFLSDFTGS